MEKRRFAGSDVLDSGKEVINRVMDKEEVPDEASFWQDDTNDGNRCIDNLKQIDLGLWKYAADHHDDNPTGNGVDGLCKLLPHVCDNTFFACPGDKNVVCSTE